MCEKEYEEERLERIKGYGSLFGEWNLDSSSSEVESCVLFSCRETVFAKVYSNFSGKEAILKVNTFTGEDCHDKYRDMCRNYKISFLESLNGNIDSYSRGECHDFHDQGGMQGIDVCLLCAGNWTQDYLDLVDVFHGLSECDMKGNENEEISALDNGYETISIERLYSDATSFLRGSRSKRNYVHDEIRAVCIMQYIMYHRYPASVRSGNLKLPDHVREKESFGYCASMLGYCYENGYGVSQNDSRAFELYRISFSCGIRSAEYSLALCYKNGIGVERDEDEYLDWLIQSARHGFATAECDLGEYYFRGAPQNGCSKKAWDYFLDAAHQGNARAIYYLGMCYERGIYVSSDYGLALECFEESAGRKYAPALYRVAFYNETGRGTDVSYRTAILYYDRAVRAGSLEAEVGLGRCFEYGHGTDENKDAAMSHYETAARRGNAEGMYAYARILIDRAAGNGCDEIDVMEAGSIEQASKNAGRRSGESIRPPQYDRNVLDIETALDYLHKAADLGYLPALNKLSHYYDTGTFVKKDKSAAYRYAVLSALNNDPRGLYNVNRYPLDRYISGSALDNDDPSAIFNAFCFLSRIQMPEGLLGLGLCYESGCGCISSRQKAYELYKESSDRCPESAYRIGCLVEKSIADNISGLSSLSGLSEEDMRSLSDAMFIMFQCYLHGAAGYVIDSCYCLGKFLNDFSMLLYEKVSEDYYLFFSDNRNRKARKKLFSLFRERFDEYVQKNMDNPDILFTYVLARLDESRPFSTLDMKDPLPSAEAISDSFFGELSHISFQCFRMSAMQSDIDSIYELGLLYEEGRGCQQSIEKAGTCFGHCVDEDDCRSMYRLGKIYESVFHQSFDDIYYAVEGETTSISSSDCIKEAYILYRDCLHSAASDSLSAAAMVALGQLYELYDDLKEDGRYNDVIAMMNNDIESSSPASEAVQLYEDAAELSSVEALSALGRCYECGIGFSRNMKKAYTTYHKAARLGHPESCMRIGFMFLNGEGRDASERQAYSYFRKAARLGSRSAAVQIAEMYRDGIFVKKDSARAISICMMMDDFPESQYMLGLMYEKGNDEILPDSGKAVSYLKRAVEGGIFEAAHHLGCIYDANIFKCANDVSSSKSENAKAIRCYTYAFSHGCYHSIVNIIGNYYRVSVTDFKAIKSCARKGGLSFSGFEETSIYVSFLLYRIVSIDSSLEEVEDSRKRAERACNHIFDSPELFNVGRRECSRLLKLLNMIDIEFEKKLRSFSA